MEGVLIFLKWTREEEEVLRKMYPKGTREAIMEALPDRTYNAITVRASRLGVSRSPLSSLGLRGRINFDPSVNLYDAEGRRVTLPVALEEEVK